MLNGILSLHDIRDTEAFAQRIIQRSPLRITGDQHEDALTYLIEEVWILSLRWNPQRSESFARYAGHLAGLRLVDWHRQRNGQHYRSGNTPPHHTPLDRAHTGSDLDPATDSPTHLMRLLRNRAGTPPQGHPQNHQRLARTAQG